MRRIVVRRDSIAVEPARIEAALAGAVSARLGGVWAVTLSDPHTRHAPMGSDVTLRVDAVEIDEARGRMTASVRVTQDGASETVRARLDALVQVPVLARPIARGAVIDAADVVMADRPASDVRATAIADAAALIGHAARRALPAGQPVRASDLERPAAIARGQTLSVEWRSGPLRLTVQGQALGDAAVGESVRIVNVASHRTIEATVIAPGRAVVAAPPAFAARPANGAAL